MTRLGARTTRVAGGRLLALLSVSICVAACGSKPAASQPGGNSSSGADAQQGAPAGSTDNSGSFVGTAANAALFVQWTRNGSQLTGELAQAILQGSGASEQVQNQSVAFTGAISGPSVTLSLNQGLGSVSNLTGTLNGQEFDLSYPGQNGGVITIPMQPGGASDFHHDLSNLQAEAGQAQTTAAQQQASQQQANSVASDAQAVVQDLSTLQSAQQNATGTGAVAGHIEQMRKDLGQTQTDLAHVLGEVGQTDSATLCGDADTVTGDADTVQGDYDTIQGDQQDAGGDANNITTAINQLKHDQQTLDADRAQDPADVPSNAPSDAQIAQAITNGQAQISAENGTTATALSQAQGMVNTAKGYAAKAQAACSAAGQ